MISVVSQSKMYRRPIGKFDAKMMRLIYSFCSKNSTNKGIYDVFLQMMGKLLGAKNQKTL